MPEWTTADHNFRTFLLVAQLEPDAIRARIRDARKQAGLTQQGLADLVERHKRTIENYENVRVPEWSELSKIARVLDKPIEWFLYGDREEANLSEQIAELARAVEAVERKLDAELAPRLDRIEDEIRRVASALEAASTAR